MTIHKLECPVCGDLARLTTSDEVYGRKIDGRVKNIFCCRNFPRCDTYVGCHPNKIKPLGTLANKATRYLRLKAHFALDALWDTTKERRNVYRRLSEDFGYEVHIGESDAAKCREIIEWTKKRRTKRAKRGQQ